MNCRLCDGRQCAELPRDARRRYYYCGICGLIFVPESFHVSVDEEKSRYDLHDNGPGHEGYIRFLNGLVSVIAEHCPAACRILDFGSGREAVLAGLLKRRGYNCSAYDPHYSVGTGALSKTYDAVVLCEVLEHLRDLKKELVTIGTAAGKSGAVIIRTRLYPSREGFSGWWYRNDITHVNFFSAQALSRLAAMLGREKVRRHGEDIFVLGGA